MLDSGRRARIAVGLPSIGSAGFKRHDAVRGGAIRLSWRLAGAILCAMPLVFTCWHPPACREDAGGQRSSCLVAGWTSARIASRIGADNSGHASAISRRSAFSARVSGEIGSLCGGSLGRFRKCLSHRHLWRRFLAFHAGCSEFEPRHPLLLIVAVSCRSGMRMGGGGHCSLASFKHVLVLLLLLCGLRTRDPIRSGRLPRG